MVDRGSRFAPSTPRAPHLHGDCSVGENSPAIVETAACPRRWLLDASRLGRAPSPLRFDGLQADQEGADLSGGHRQRKAARTAQPTQPAKKTRTRLERAPTVIPAAQAHVSEAPTQPGGACFRACALLPAGAARWQAGLRCEGGGARALHRIPDGGGGRTAGPVRAHPRPDRPAASADPGPMLMCAWFGDHAGQGQHAPNRRPAPGNDCQHDKGKCLTQRSEPD